MLLTYDVRPISMRKYYFIKMVVVSKQSLLSTVFSPCFTKSFLYMSAVSIRLSFAQLEHNLYKTVVRLKTILK